VAANITIDGFTAPAPGITLRNYELMIHGWSSGGALGANNVIVRGIRSRDAYVATGGNPADGISILATSNVVIDHVSVIGFGDGAIDVSDGTRDVTIQWSIFAEGSALSNKISLIKYNTARISLHHNLFINGNDRQPFCGGSDTATSIGPEVVCDVRNNLMWNYSWVATAVRQFGSANVVNNYYHSQALASNPDAALYIREGGIAYASGNYSPSGINIDAKGNRATPFAAIVPTTTDAITAAHQIVAQAGARGPRFGLDAIDLARIMQISLMPQP
jgi:pectate lyase